MYFSDATKKTEGQVDAPAPFFQKVVQSNCVLLFFLFVFSTLNSSFKKESYNCALVCRYVIIRHCIAGHCGSYMDNHVILNR